MFEPRLALASLSGRSDANWAGAAADHAGAAFLGGIALDERSREAARKLVEREREEFLPPDPLSFVAEQFEALANVPIRPGINVRATDAASIEAVAECCTDHDALCEINAHCRQPELRAVGCGETLLSDTERLREYVQAAAETGAETGVKVRAEVDGVDLRGLAAELEGAGASFVHVDAMDTESVIGEVAGESDLFVIANNGIRGRESVAEYLAHGADAVSVGRPSTDPVVLERVRRALLRCPGDARLSTDG